MGRWQAQVTSEQKVKLVHPKAEVRWNENSRIWGVFFDGPPSLYRHTLRMVGT